MKERGIIFNAEMVRAILDGRKTQTRRIMKPQPTPCDYIDWRGKVRGGHVWPSNIFRTMLHVEGELQNGAGGWLGLVGDACPFGNVGDRLWVRETFGLRVLRDALGGTGEFITYRASNPDAVYCAWDGGYIPIKWRPSSQMTRRRSRILLEITGVRVERLQDISGEDARSEGFICTDSPAMGDIDEFSHTWKSTYGEDSWPANPWVWVIEFRRVTP
ncbi:hypothetical protein Q4R15_17715 [Morganella morganii]|nr:hypothetical protein [Morganella morganii]